MLYILLTLGSILLFTSFVGMTMFETRTGHRFLAPLRTRLDMRAGRAGFIIGHVNWSDFIAHVVQSAAARVAHDLAHWTLIVIRFVERQLTRVVRYQRDRRPVLLAPKPSRTSPLSQTAAYLRKTLRLNREKTRKNP